MGYTLRSIFNDKRNIPRLEYALVLAFGQMQPGFCYCCEKTKLKDVRQAYKKLIHSSVKWWKQRKSPKLVQKHKRSKRRFVKNKTKHEDVHVMLTDELEVDMNEFMNLKFERYETAVALANEMHKPILSFAVEVM